MALRDRFLWNSKTKWHRKTGFIGIVKTIALRDGFIGIAIQNGTERQAFFGIAKTIALRDKFSLIAKHIAFEEQPPLEFPKYSTEIQAPLE